DVGRELALDLLEERVDVVASGRSCHLSDYSTPNLLTSRDPIASLSISKCSRSRERRWGRCSSTRTLGGSRWTVGSSRCSATSGAVPQRFGGAGGGSQLRCGSPSQQPSLNRHRAHCHVPCRHSIAAPQRQQASAVTPRES